MAIYVKRVRGDCDDCILVKSKLCPVKKAESLSRVGGYKFWCVGRKKGKEIGYCFRHATPEEIKRHLEKSEE